MGHSQILQESVGIIGAGVAGLINAHVLLQDGFVDVTLITRDESVGGTWARNRVYPGLHLNKYDLLLLTFELSVELLITSVHGEYRLSPLEMPPPEDGSQRLSGFDLCKYVEKFADKFVLGRAKFHFQTEVLNIERDEDGKWNVAVEDLPTKSLRTLTFSRIILATGVSRTISTIFGVTYLDNSTSIIKGCSNPHVPAAISQTAAEKAQFRGIVIHSSQFGPYLDKIRETVKPISSNSDPDDGDTVIVVGGGKSSKELVDIHTYAYFRC
jgi:dimethylaniline monooxygenase (N-oxide forming)